MIVNSIIELDRDELSQREWKKLLTKLTFLNAARDEVRAYSVLANGNVRIPRGAWNLLPNHVQYVDATVSPSAPALPYAGTLDYSDPSKSFTGQEDAVQAALTNWQGLIVRGPGTGKTQIALAIISRLRTPAIVFVHTEDIFNQWIERARDLLDIEPSLIQGQDWQTGRVTIAMVQTVNNDLRQWARISGRFGCVIIDEAHHAPADTWVSILSRSPARYRYGFTATNKRADGMQKMISFLIGPEIHRQKIQVKVPTVVHPLKSGFYFPYRGRFDWSALQEALLSDIERNTLIAKTALRQIAKGRSTLILSRRIEHLDNILFRMTELNGAAPSAAILTGKVPKQRRLRMVEDFREGKIKCLLATQLADEALDVPILSRIILAWVGKAEGRIIQQVGRALREHADKDDAVIFDIVDDRVGVLKRQWRERTRAYGNMGIPIKRYKEEANVTPQQQRRLTAHRIRDRISRGRRAS